MGLQQTERARERQRPEKVRALPIIEKKGYTHGLKVKLISYTW